MAVVTPANSEALSRQEQTMRYRPLGKTGWEVSALSMGCMRLGADQDLNTRVVARAVELGINYFETTRWYCEGKCQHRTAPGFKGQTAGLVVSGKCGIGPDSTAASFRLEIETQLEILGLSHFKFFQVGWFGWDRIGHLLKRGGVLEALRRAQDEGLVQRIGFTGHDTPENFIRCIETGLFDCITVPYNMVNRAYEPTIKRAGELGVGVVAMCPVAGGVLAADSSKLRAALNLDLPSAALALRFVLANPNISTACSGMNTIAMLEENAQTALAFDPGQADFTAMCAGLDKLRAAFGDKICTACRYCLPCPQGIDIPRAMELFRNWQAFGLEDGARQGVAAMPDGKAPADCTACGACEEKCPNDLPVRETMTALREL